MVTVITHLFIKLVVGYIELLVMRQLCCQHGLPLSHLVLVRGVRLEELWITTEQASVIYYCHNTVGSR